METKLFTNSSLNIQSTWGTSGSNISNTTLKRAKIPVAGALELNIACEHSFAFSRSLIDIENPLVVASTAADALSQETTAEALVTEGETSAILCLRRDDLLPVSKFFPLATDVSKSKHRLRNPRCCPDVLTCTSIHYF
jgi:hypothetical protein